MKKEQGAILVMGAFILIILIGIAAFALDLGRLYVLRTEMQNAVDAAAISAASELDGKAGARDRAMVAANQEVLSHLAHFSKQSELLKNLQDKDFTFYSWIGSSSDSSEKPCSEPEDGKCEATGDADASYVKIKLEPADADDSDYTVDLYFLPILSLISSEPVATTASTQVEALAGSQLKVCNFPPLFICDPTEGGGPDLIPGQMVVLHEQGGPSAPWSPGTFGWLQPTKDVNDDDPNDDGLTSNKLLAYRLGSKYGQECTSTIEVKGGQIANWPRWGLNTRFGLYKRPEYRNEFFPSAPNVVDYPRDDNLTLIDSGECGPSGQRFGNTQWLNTECADQPSTYSWADYNSNYHGDVGTDHGSRLEYYNWELEPLVNLPENKMDNADLHDNEEQCLAGDDKACRMLFGDPNLLNIVPNTIDYDDSYKRRELFVGVVACAANDVKANSILNIEEVGAKWMRFFMTEHVSPPSTPSGGVTIHAEFVDEVIEDEDEHFKKIIQLYE